MTDQQYTPTTDLMRQWHVLADHSGNKSTEEYEAEFDRWLATVEAAAEQRGAARVLRETADHIAATDHYMIDGDKYTPCSSCKSIHYQYLDYRADLLEGDDD